MKTKISSILLALLVLSVSCEKETLTPSKQTQEQIKEDTPESILIGVQNKYTYDSYSETNTDYTVVFHDPQSIKLIQNYPDGIERVTIKKSEISSWKDNKSNISIQFKSGKTATLNKYCRLIINYDNYGPLSFETVGETKTIGFTIGENTEKNITVVAKSSNTGFSVAVSMNSNKTAGTVSITNNTSTEKDAEITLTADNGVGRKVNSIKASYENFYFVQDGTSNPWGERDERIDGKSDVNLNFDIELARMFYLNINKGDIGAATYVSADAKNWLSSKIVIHEVGNGTQRIQLCVEMTKNTGSQYRTGTVFVKSSKGKQIKVTVSQISEQMSNSMRSVLMSFYNACNGSNWDNKTGWGTNAEIVDWYGLLCFGCPNGYGRNKIEALYDEWLIELPNNNLTGTIPSSFWNIIDRFTTVDLGYNKFAKQPLDERIWTKHIRKIDLNSCFAFTGSISPKIGDCRNLYFLGLCDNQLSGKIPEEIYNCTEISHLEIGNIYEGAGNRYNSSLSAKIKNLQKLEWLDLDRCGIYGKIPSELYSLKNLTYISLGINNIEGELPSNFQNLEGIGFFNISENELTGKLPENIYQIDWTTLCGNHFIQNIPESVRYSKKAWKVDNLWWLSSQRYKNAPKSLKEDGTSAGYWRDELYYNLPMPDWAKERFGTWKWNQVDQKKPKYPYADDLQYPANEYYYDGKDWRHPKYEHPARFYHKVNGEWAYDPDWNWNHTTDPPITEVPEWPGVNR